MALVAFDLDDTLFPEVEFLHSGWRKIASVLSDKYLVDFMSVMRLMAAAANPFDELKQFLTEHVPAATEDVDWMVTTYRKHYPTIGLPAYSRRCLETLRDDGHHIAIVTDGRVLTQTNKIRALGLLKYFDPDDIFISESVGEDKLGGKAFRELDLRYAEENQKYYIGDNPAKDFYWPNKLGWTTVMVKGDRRNIHSQKLPADKNFHPHHIINYLSSFNKILK